MWGLLRVHLIYEWANVSLPCFKHKHGPQQLEHRLWGASHEWSEWRNRGLGLPAWELPAHLFSTAKRMTAL